LQEVPTLRNFKETFKVSILNLLFPYCKTSTCYSRLINMLFIVYPGKILNNGPFVWQYYIKVNYGQMRRSKCWLLRNVLHCWNFTAGIQSYINVSFQKKVFCKTQNEVLTAWGKSDKRGVFRRRKEQVTNKQIVLCHQYGSF